MERQFLDLSFSLHNIPRCDMIKSLQCLVLKMFWFWAEQKQSENPNYEKLELHLDYQIQMQF